MRPVQMTAVTLPRPFFCVQAMKTYKASYGSDIIRIPNPVAKQGRETRGRQRPRASHLVPLLQVPFVLGFFGSLRSEGVECRGSQCKVATVTRCRIHYTTEAARDMFQFIDDTECDDGFEKGSRRSEDSALGSIRSVV